jgi:hypothetical protein
MNIQYISLAIIIYFLYIALIPKKESFQSVNASLCRNLSKKDCKESWICGWWGFLGCQPLTG